MLPAPLCRYEVRGGMVEPAYLDGRHAELARAVLLHYDAFAGRPLRELDGALADLPELRGHEPRLIAGLRRVIDEWIELEVAAPVAPRRLRAAVFALGRRDRDLEPETVFARAAAELGVEAAGLQEHLYADLGDERRLRFAFTPPGAAEIVSRYNFRLLQGLLLAASRLRVELREGVRAVYRFAKLHGLLLELKEDGGETASYTLEITGPLSLFQRTRKYGRALARFLPACAAAPSFRLEAALALRGRELTLVATHADRVLSPYQPLHPYDSKLEAAFHRDFVRLASRWDIFREAELVPLGGTVFLPDFSFRLRDEPRVQADLEIVGFWTRDYLARKLTLFRLLGERARRPVIVCVDRELCCDLAPEAFPCIAFSGRVPAEKVLEALEAIAARHAKS